MLKSIATLEVFQLYNAHEIICIGNIIKLDIHKCMYVLTKIELDL